MSTKQGKKMIIFKKNNDTNKLEALRSVTVHHTFEGINERGQIDITKFRGLANILEPKVPIRDLQVKVLGL